MKNKYLVTGVAGFIGSHIAEELLKRGDEVIGIDNFYSGNIENIKFLQNIGKNRFSFENIDIRDLSFLKRIFKDNKITHIFHLAAIASVQKSIDNPTFTNSVNIVGTLNILEMAREFNIKRVVFSSSAAVYGDEPTLPKDETSKISPISPYGYEKLIGEQYMTLYNNLYGVETVSLRYFNVYGERQDPTSEYSGVISIFEDKISKNLTANIYGNGKQYRDFIYVKDVVNINLLAMEKDIAVGEIFACGTESTTTILELFNIIKDKYKRSFQPNFLESRNGDIKESVCKNSKIKSLLGFKEFTKFTDGIKILWLYLEMNTDLQNMS